MSIINFGPATITHEGQDLGKTTGGGGLTLREQTYRGLRSGEETKIITGGEGIINLFEFEDSILISDDAEFLDYGELVIEATNMKITLASCKINFVPEIQFGEMKQYGWQLRLDFKTSAGTNPYVINVE